MSESMVRFAAYSSVLIGGAQALWWEGMGKCAPVGSDQFALIGDINNRISQWCDRHLLSLIFHMHEGPLAHDVIFY